MLFVLSGPLSRLLCMSVVLNFSPSFSAATLNAVLAAEYPLRLAMYVVFGGIFVFTLLTHPRVSGRRLLKPLVVASTLLLVGLMVSSLVYVPLVKAETTAVSGYYLARPIPGADWYLGKLSDGTFYAINGSSWNDLTAVEPWQSVAPWASFASSSSDLEQHALASLTYGEVYLKEVPFSLALMSSIPANVQVVDNINGVTYTYVNPSSSLGSPYTVSVGQGNNAGYYVAVDSGSRVCWASVNANSVFTSVFAASASHVNVVGSITSDAFNIPANVVLDLSQSYLTTLNPLQITGSNVEIIGGTINNINRWSSTVIYALGSGNSLYASTHLSNIFFDKVAIIGNRERATGTGVESLGMNGIQLQFVDNSTVEECPISNCSENGYFLGNYSSGNTIDSCTLTNNGNYTALDYQYGGAYGAGHGLGQDISINFFCDGNKVTNNIVQSSGQNQIRVSASNNTLMANNKISGALSDNHNGAIYLTVARGTIIKGNLIYGNPTDGIWGDDKSWNGAFPNNVGGDNIIEGNYIHDNLGSGIVSATGAINWTISGNICQNDGANIAGSNILTAEINLSHSFGTSVTSNTFQPSYAATYGAIFSDCSNCSVNYNDFSDLVYGGVFFAGTSALPEVYNQFEGDTIENTVQSGLTLDFCNGMTVSGCTIAIGIGTYPITISGTGGGVYGDSDIFTGNQLHGTDAPYISGISHLTNYLIKNNIGFPDQVALPTGNLQIGMGSDTSTWTMATGVSVTAGTLLVNNSTGTYIANPTSIHGLEGTIGIATQSVGAGLPVVVVTRGYFEDDSWSLDTTNPYAYISLTGAVTQTYPSNPGNIADQIGIPYSNHIIWIQNFGNVGF